MTSTQAGHPPGVYGEWTRRSIVSLTPPQNIPPRSSKRRDEHPPGMDGGVTPNQIAVMTPSSFREKNCDFGFAGGLCQARVRGMAGDGRLNRLDGPSLAYFAPRPEGV